MGLQNMLFQLEEDIYKELKLFCQERDISIREFMRAAIAKTLKGTNREIILSSCRHEKGTCWGTCGSDPSALKIKDKTNLDQSGNISTKGKF